MAIRALLLAVALAVPQIVMAQSVMRAETAPAAVAGDTAWHRAGEPVQHRGAFYYPGGAQTFFDGNRLVLVGEFRGVPVYADPTLETGSVIYVPVSGRLMQPYELRRQGALAGTSGSRTPSYPPDTPSPISAADDDVRPVGTSGIVPSPPMTDDDGRALAPDAPVAVEIIAPSAAVRGSGIWVTWDGVAWNAAGPAVRVGAQFVVIGTLDGRTVYRGPGGEGTIWIETAQGLATPWKKERD